MVDSIFSGSGARRAFIATFPFLAALCLAGGAARGEIARGSMTFASERQCASSGKIPSDICAYAEANSAAEFDEKAPRFPSRALCERAYGGGACSIGFRGAAGWAGRKQGVYFSPRRQGFRVTAHSERDVTVTPLAAGLSFSSRSALRRDTSINPRAARERSAAPVGLGGPQPPGDFGAPTAEGAKGVLPPRPPVDPNFDCAAVLEPSDQDPSTGCVLAPVRKR